ncbi:hypothetical protein ncot_04045 [Nocardioides sp. JQ2195]|uniref:hypothetical protein n=1 Tax=Nocardioides sp. JQ2195 TaxID=2592334 RepID=UPI00143EC4AC|nr:hypothetical protein [Nocardioides sp. JQ2195]QIX25860.1 hypothetical protein ncot_04045 [Nocardioides sp. JQ2195]
MRCLLALLVGLLLLAGCGSAPERIAATGTDDLTIPTPSPDPDDFVESVTNRWLPLETGRRWTYDASGGRARSRTVTVLDETRTVDGVSTTVVRTLTRSRKDRVISDTESWFAQDTAGNVWLFGRTGPGGWEAGVAGAQATLAMAAAPRHGDGYAAAFVGGRVVRTAEVLLTDGSAATPYGDFDDVVEIEELPVSEGRSTVLSYAPGIGLVEQRAIEGVDLRLASIDE